MWWKKIVFRNFFLAGGILIILTMVGIIIVRSFLPPVIPLFYGKPTGLEQLATNVFIFIVPGIAMVVGLLNFVIGSISENEFVKKLLAITFFIVSLMATITVVKIVMLVGFF